MPPVAIERFSEYKSAKSACRRRLDWRSATDRPARGKLWRNAKLEYRRRSATGQGLPRTDVQTEYCKASAFPAHMIWTRPEARVSTTSSPTPSLGNEQREDLKDKLDGSRTDRDRYSRQSGDTRDLKCLACDIYGRRPRKNGTIGLRQNHSSSSHAERPDSDCFKPRRRDRLYDHIHFTSATARR